MLLTLPGSQEPSYSPLRGKKHTAAKHRCQRFHTRLETFSRPSAMRNTLNGKPVCPKAEREAWKTRRKGSRFKKAPLPLPPLIRDHKVAGILPVQLVREILSAVQRVERPGLHAPEPQRRRVERPPAEIPVLQPPHKLLCRMPMFRRCRVPIRAF